MGRSHVTDQAPNPDPSLDQKKFQSDRFSEWLPIIEILRQYSLSYFLKDVVAGIVLTAILIPAGMAYAEAAGLPAIHGLYATIVVLIAYALLGPSRILVLGPDSSLAALIAATILPLAAGDVRGANCRRDQAGLRAAARNAW